MYANGKMRPIETVPGMGGQRRMMEGISSTMIYCENFLNVIITPVQQNDN
jgi:hypothetical protein